MFDYSKLKAAEMTHQPEVKNLYVLEKVTKKCDNAESLFRSVLGELFTPE